MLLTSAFIALILVGVITAIYESFVGTTILMIGTGVLYHYTKQNVWHLIVANYQTILMFTPVYLTIGVGWSFIKWFLFLIGFKKFRQANVDLYKSGLFCTTFYKGLHITDVPKASNFKSDIIAWMCWWPFSIIGTLISDPIRKFFTFMYNTFSGAYQRMADKIVPKIEGLK